MTREQLALVARLRNSVCLCTKPAADLIESLAARVPKAKPLEWHKSHISCWNGDWHTLPTGYTVRCCDENGWKWSYNGGFGYEPSPELAQAAAETDHQARWLAEWGGWA